jgi:hypothetical protein
MKSLAPLLLATLSASGATIVDEMSDIQFWVGSGANSAVLVLDWQDGKAFPGDTLGRTLAWGYRWPANETRKGLDLLLAVDAADPRLQLNFISFGPGLGQALFGAYYDLDGDGGTPTFDPVNELGSASDPADHFREGFRFNGFWGYLLGTAAGPTLPGWMESGSGANARTLSDGSWDAWSYSEDLAFFTIPNPGVIAAAPAVPEPAACGWGVGLAIGLLRRRR